jgi:hypothetical protein
MRLSRIVAAGLWMVTAVAAVAWDDGDARVREIVLKSQRMGAHGLGYNNESLRELSQKLRPDDVAALMRLTKEKDGDVSVGAEFGLASQCEAAIDPVRRAAEKPADMRLAEEVLELIAKNEACTEEVRKEGTRNKNEVSAARKAYYQKRAEELAAERANDQRIQANGLKMTDPQRSKELTFDERMEVFQRSVKAAGLDHPKTPEQKALVDRMYRTMVLGESDGKKTPN